MQERVSVNFGVIKFWHFGVLFGFLVALLVIFHLLGLSDVSVYPQINKGIFLAINELFSHAPKLAHNLTQLGDATVLFALMLGYALIVPKCWEAIFAGSLMALFFTNRLKEFYDMPRPARVFDNDSFNIIGEKLAGHTSFPSGHSTSIFCILFVVMIALMPKSLKWRVVRILGFIILASFVGLSRMGVGAHYPLDVVVGALLGCLCGLGGILIAHKTRIFAWCAKKWALLIFLLVGASCVVRLLQGISEYNLFVFYVAMFSAVLSSFFILRRYFSWFDRPVAFIFVAAAFQVVAFHSPLFSYICANLSLDNFQSFVLFISLALVLFMIVALMPLLLALISFKLSQIWLGLTFFTNSIAFYFVANYGVFLDKNMMGNLFNTNTAEAGEFLSLKMALYIFILGVIPAYFVISEKLAKPTRKRLLKFIGVIFLLIIILAGINFKNLLWFDKNSKQLGALIMPYSYTINSARFLQGEFSKNKKEILLPEAKIKDDKKAVFVLVIGESARAANFSLYDYKRETNPLLKKVANLHKFKANSSTTYTSASVKNMLSHKDSGSLYEILPNYLARNGVDVFWRSTNWGEPPLHIENVARYESLAAKYGDDGYELALVSGLKDEIAAAKSPKILIIIHTSTSHGPTYFKKYPREFEAFRPACESTEPKGCTAEEIINAYDNTIVYTDFLLNRILEQLGELKGYESAMMYVSDHGESLGEGGIFMHGIPMAIAPKEQYEIPFLVWNSSFLDAENSSFDGVKDTSSVGAENSSSFRVKNLSEATHFHIFHSVLDFLGVESEILDKKMSVFEDLGK